MSFVDKFAPAPPTRRARSRWIAGSFLATLLVLAFLTVSHQQTVIDRMREARKQGLGLGFRLGWVGSVDGGEEGSASLGSNFVGLAESAGVAKGPNKVSALPRPRLADPSDKETKYIGFLPHSGYHNQRIGLENALLLGHLLNRTVLVPPIWIGWPPFTAAYVRLQREWTTALALNPNSFALSADEASLDSPLAQAVNFDSSEQDSTLESMIEKIREEEATIVRQAAYNERKYREKGWEVRPDGYPITNLTAAECKSYSVECRHTYKDTFLAWDFVANLDSLAEIVPIVDRWDMRQRALLPSLGVEESDVFVLRDTTKHDFQFSDEGEFGLEDAPLLTLNSARAKFNRTVSITALDKVPHRVLLVGSLFGSDRVKTSLPERKELKESFSRSLAFRNPWIIRPADEIAQRLGGSYLGVHARVGDGGFLKAAKKNMEESWKWLCHLMKVDKALVDQLWLENESSKRAKRSVVHLALEERSAWAELEEENAHREEPHLSQKKILERVGEDLGSEGMHKRAPVSTSWSLNNLTCRAPLHTEPHMLQFNKPLYLATDSRDPVNDPLLAIFFKTFPCTFILSDFDRPGELNAGVVVDSVEQMSRLENENDNLPLGRLFLPFLEAVIAAKADLTTGTSSSTFSAFAEGAMHRAYLAEREP